MGAIPAIFPVSVHLLFVYHYSLNMQEILFYSQHILHSLTHTHTIYPHAYGMGSKWLKKYKQKACPVCWLDLSHEKTGK